MLTTDLAKPKVSLDILWVQLHDLSTLSDGQLWFALTQTAEGLVQVELKKNCLPLFLLLRILQSLLLQQTHSLEEIPIIVIHVYIDLCNFWSICGCQYLD